MLKVCIYGGGAIGGYIAAHLARAGQCEVTVIARGRNLQAIQARGLTVTTPNETFNVAVRTVADTADVGRQDYVFITLKAHQIESALDQIKRLMDEDTVVMPPTTGIPYYFFHDWDGPLNDRRLPAVDPHGRQWSLIPPRQILGCVYWIGAHADEPGVIVQDGPKAGCPVGELDGRSSQRVARLSELLESSGIAARINSNIRSAIWVKFVNSLCWNPVAALTLARLGAIGQSPDALNVVKSMMDEADSIARALGLHLGQSPDKRIALTLTAADHKMSMLQDLERGRALEIDVLEQSLHALREVAQVTTPTLDAILALAKLRATVASH